MTQRNIRISIFVMLWLVLFNYESLRLRYLSPALGVELPKCPFLFPPAGWIMFFQVSSTEVRAEVYGKKGPDLEKLDPHRIFDNHWIGYDNIRRNVLVSVLDPRTGGAFCRFLKRKFPGYDSFYVMQGVYSAAARERAKWRLQTVYTC